MKAIALGVCMFAISMFVIWMAGVDVLARSGEAGSAWAVSIWIGGYTAAVWSGVPA